MQWYNYYHNIINNNKQKKLQNNQVLILNMLYYLFTNFLFFFFFYSLFPERGILLQIAKTEFATGTESQPENQNQSFILEFLNFPSILSFHPYIQLHWTLLSPRISHFPRITNISQGNYGIRGILVDWQSIFRSKGRAYLQPGYVNNGDVFRAICESPLHDWWTRSPWHRTIIPRLTRGR